MNQGDAGAAIELPRNVEAEAALLGALMIENNLIVPVTELVDAQDFFEPMHGRIFSAILEQSAKGGAANPITLKPYLDQDPALLELGGMGYLARLTGSGGAVIGARDFASQINWLGKRRRIVLAMQATIERALDTSTYEPVESLVEDIDVAVTGALAHKDKASSMTIAAGFDRALDRLRRCPASR
jgi:replicative DNA helicase